MVKDVTLLVGLVWVGSQTPAASNPSVVFKYLGI